MCATVISIRAVFCCGSSWLIYLSFSTFFLEVLPWPNATSPLPKDEYERFHLLFLPLKKSFSFTNEGGTCQTDPHVYLLIHKSCVCIVLYTVCFFLTSHGWKSMVVTVTLAKRWHSLDDHIYNFILHTITENQRKKLKKKKTIYWILKLICVQVVNDSKCFCFFLFKLIPWHTTAT